MLLAFIPVYNEEERMPAAKSNTKTQGYAPRSKDDENVLSIYLKEINKIPLLTRE
ncbi:MAG: sigma-70 factor domain-containing protein, partial [Spirochaetota bacterium]